MIYLIDNISVHIIYTFLNVIIGISYPIPKTQIYNINNIYIYICMQSIYLILEITNIVQVLP